MCLWYFILILDQKNTLIADNALHEYNENFIICTTCSLYNNILGVQKNADSTSKVQATKTYSSVHVISMQICSQSAL